MRYWYNPETKQVEPIGQSFDDGTPRGGLRTSEGELYNGQFLQEPVQTGDPKRPLEVRKVDVSSRKKWREYMKATGTTGVSDYTETWKKAAKERELVPQHGNREDHAERKEQIGRALYQLRNRGRR